ncbi:MAG: hypothetical protein K0S09_2912 [Sphingobacteriaceae bacterium]|jgi:hypothetical protein|nr:hypothetical protein [Sphingobacteriaceae bacterium]
MAIQIRKASLITAFFLFSLTLAITAVLNFHSTIAYGYYLLFFTCFILLIDKDETLGFIKAFLINAFITVLYIGIQSYVYPNTYGTTSPLGAWTDDSFFFTLVADSFPRDMYIERENYFLYTAFFTDTIKLLTPFQIHHPADVIYFQSGVAGILAIYTKQYTTLLTEDKETGTLAYYLCVFCPFLLMHGGAVLIRDTFVAALFISSLCFLKRRRYILALIFAGMEFPLRSGTALIYMILYFVIYSKEITAFFFKKKNVLYSITALIIVVTGAFYTRSLIFSTLENLFLEKGVTLAGRELYEDLTKGGNPIFVFIQNQNFVIKSLLSGLYIFLYPFLSFSGIINAQGIDIRTFLLNIVYPIYAFWLNAWFFAFVLQKKMFFEKRKVLLFAFALGFILIGIFSLQTRHKTIMQPLFYVFVAAGLHYSEKRYRILGYGFAFLWFIVQFLISLRIFFR